MGKHDFCCVPGCSALRNVNRGLHFYSIPKNPQRRKLWLRAIRRSDPGNKSKLWQPGPSATICSRHFVGGKKSDIPAEANYIPTIFSWNVQHIMCGRKTSNSRRSSTCTSTQDGPHRKPDSKKTKVMESSKPGRPKVESQDGMEKDLFAKVWLTSDHDYVKTRKDSQENVPAAEMYAQMQKLLKENEALKAENESLKRASFCLENIKDDDNKVRFWTGFPNYGTFMAVFKYLQPKAKTMKYWRGETTFNFSHYSNSHMRKPGKERQLTLEQEFFAVLVRLKGGLLVEDIADRFGISSTSFSKMFSSWINLMHQEFNDMFSLQSQENKESQADVLKDFPDVVITLDCTELFVEKPSDLDPRKQLYSNYKHHETIKFLIGVSPSLAVTFCSRCYGGRASDKFIVGKSSKLLESLHPGDAVLADKGFKVEGELNELGVKLIIPDFKGSNRSQMTPEELKRSSCISRVRVHVERVIQRIKTYHILDRNLRLSMKDTIEQIFVVCAFLTNFQTPVVKKPKVAVD